MNNETKVGFFILAALAVIGYFIVKTNSENAFWKSKPKTREIRVLVTNASGIRDGTPVRIAGVKVGKVDHIELEGGTAILVLEVKDSIKIYENAAITLESQGILGERYVSLNPGDGQLMQGLIQVKGNVPASIENLTGNFYQISEDLKVIIANLRASTTNETGNNRLEVIAQNLEQMSALLLKILEENRSELHATTNNINAITGELRNTLPLLLENIHQLSKLLHETFDRNAGNFDTTMGNLAQTSQKLDQAMLSFSSISQKIDQGKGSLGKLINDEETALKMDEIMDTAKEALGQVREFLNKADAIDLSLGVQSDYLAEHDAYRSAFQLKLSPNARKYYLIEAWSRETNYLPIGVKEKIEETFDSEGNLISRTVITEEDELDEFGFGAQLAYRFRNAFLRGGLIEGEGGIGVDYLFNKQSILFTLDAYDFSRPNDLTLHTRAGFEYEFKNRIRLRLGWDDFLESDLDSAYLGLGLRWKDDDIKPLISTLGRAF